MSVNPKPRARTEPAELHLFLEEVNEKTGVPKYRVEIQQLFLGTRRTIRTFPAHGHHKERLVLRLAAKYRVPRDRIVDHTHEVSTVQETSTAQENPSAE